MTRIVGPATAIMLKPVPFRGRDRPLRSRGATGEVLVRTWHATEGHDRAAIRRASALQLKEYHRWVTSSFSSGSPDPADRHRADPKHVILRGDEITS